jgi:GNAT superfamily N-acetyltransferase
MAKIELTDSPSPEDLAVITEGLTDFNELEVGPSERRLLAVLIHDENCPSPGKVIGGLSGYTAWGWLFTQLLFIPESLRGQGMASRLLNAAEKEARARGCGGACIDTFNPVALQAYKRQGYEVFGELPAFVCNRTRSFLRKTL